MLEALRYAKAIAGRGEVEALMDRTRRILGKIHADDREEAIDLLEKLEAAIAAGDSKVLEEASGQLKELLFFVEGK